MPRSFGGANSLVGELSDANFWDKPLGNDELKSWTSCKSMTKGNIVNWETTLFLNENMTEMELNKEEICQPISPGFVVLPEIRTFQDSHRFLICQTPFIPPK